MVPQNNPKKLKTWDLSKVFSIDTVPTLSEDKIHWSCERFWCIVSFDPCFIRRYTLEEVEIEEHDDGEW